MRAYATQSGYIRTQTLPSARTARGPGASGSRGRCFWEQEAERLLFYWRRRLRRLSSQCGAIYCCPGLGIARRLHRCDGVSERGIERERERERERGGRAAGKRRCLTSTRFLSPRSQKQRLIWKCYGLHCVKSPAKGMTMGLLCRCAWGECRERWVGEGGHK